MRIITITEAKNGLSALIDHVRGGDSVLIVDRGIPVARLESAVSGEAETGGKLARLERQGAVRVATGPPAYETLSAAPPAPEAGASALQSLLEERREGR